MMLSLLKLMFIKIRYKLYKHLRGNFVTDPWKRLLCNNTASPKSVFITWMAAQHKLVTKDRLLQWGLSIDPVCVLCGVAPEIIHHLFFQCYTTDIWEKFLKLLGVSRQV